MTRSTVWIAVTAAAIALHAAAAAADLQACLAAAIPTVLSPGDSMFAANAALRNWQGRHDSRKPAAVVFPGTATQVRRVIRCLSGDMVCVCVCAVYIVGCRPSSCALLTPPAAGVQVAAAIQCANAAGTPFVARSGGHSYEAESIQQVGIAACMQLS